MHQKNLYFNPTTGLEPSTEVDYKELDKLRHYMNDISDINYAVFYYVDFLKQNLYYFTDNAMLLCGYSMEEASESGFAFFEKVVPADDLEMLSEVTKKWFGIYYDLPAENQEHCHLSVDIRMIRNNGFHSVVNHNFKPVLFTPEGKIWILLCCVQKSIFKQPGNAVIILGSNEESYLYSAKAKKFKPHNSKPLTESEMRVKSLMDMGLTKANIADSLRIKPGTVKYHKKNITSKKNSHLRDTG